MSRKSRQSPIQRLPALLNLIWGFAHLMRPGSRILWMGLVMRIDMHGVIWIATPSNLGILRVVEIKGGVVGMPKVGLGVRRVL